MRTGGYQTAMIGKWHLKSEPVGFDYWKVLPGQGNYYNPDFRTPNGRERIEGYVTDIVTDVSLEWLENGRDKSKPFVLMTQHKAPHRAWLPGPDHLNMYDSVTIPEPETLFDNYENRASGAAVQEMEIDRHMRFSWDLKLVRDESDTVGQMVWEDRKNRFTPEQLKERCKIQEERLANLGPPMNIIDRATRDFGQDLIKAPSRRDWAAVKDAGQESAISCIVSKALNGLLNDAVVFNEGKRREIGDMGPEVAVESPCRRPGEWTPHNAPR